ncbi:hypothetical protein ACVBEH_33925, partial [Roseateles sp. GG27B]
GWLPPLKESARRIQRLSQAVDGVAQMLRHRPDAEVAARFHREVQALRTGHAVARDFDHLPAVLACVAEACR